jgi:hypothetical protein
MRSVLGEEKNMIWWSSSFQVVIRMIRIRVPKHNVGLVVAAFGMGKTIVLLTADSYEISMEHVGPW